MSDKVNNFILTALVALFFAGTIVTARFAGNSGGVDSIPLAHDSSVDAAINGEVQRLTNGKIAFESPQKMGLNETKLVEVRVARNFNQDLSSGLASSGHAVIEDITVGPYMAAELSGSAFQITPVTPVNQVIPEDKFTAWRWQVHPTDWGKQQLFLQVCARLQLPNKREEPWCSDPIYQREIAVQVSLWYATTRFIGNNATWTLGTVFGSLGPAGGFILWLRKRRKERRETVLTPL